MIHFIGKLLIILFLINFQDIAKANIQNKIILKIDNEIVTDYEFKNKIFSILLLSGEEINQANIDKIKKPALDSLVQLKLKKIELSKYKISTDQNQIRNYLTSISSNNIDKFKKNFRDNNLDFQLYLDEVETQFKWQKLIYKLYSNKINFEENSINDDLKSLIKDQSSVEEFKISELEINTNKQSMESDIKNIQDLIQSLGFEKTAFQYSVSSTASNNGNLGWVNSKILSPQVYNIIKNLKLGEVSKPIIKQNNLIFFKLTDKKKSSINNVKVDELREKLINQKKK